MEVDLQQTRFRQLLTRELAERQIKNPSYSVRAFSQRLGINHSALSEILNGKRRIGPHLGKRLASALMLDGETQASLIPQRTKQASHQRASRRPTFTAVLEADQYRLISDWYHFAILSLSETADFQSRSSWIANRLGITHKQAKDATARLLRLNLLTLQNGKLHPTGASFSSPDEIRDLGVRKTQHQYLSKAQASLESSQLDERDFIGMTMAIDPQKLPEAKRRIRRFRDELCGFLESGKKKEVYQLCVQLFSLSKGF